LPSPANTASMAAWPSPSLPAIHCPAVLTDSNSLSCGVRKLVVERLVSTSHPGGRNGSHLHKICNNLGRL